MEILSHEEGILAETIFTHNDLQNIGKQIDFDIYLNTVGTLEFRVVPLCLGEIVFSEVNFQKKISETKTGK